jgi:hypothetical protein
MIRRFGKKRNTGLPAAADNATSPVQCAQAEARGRLRHQREEQENQTKSTKSGGHKNLLKAHADEFLRGGKVGGGELN